MNEATRTAGPLRLDALVVGPLGPIDLTIAPGEIVALSGPSGSGKSRLLRAVADLDEHGGSAALGSTGQGELPAHRWRQAVMLLPAESLWWADTVGEHFPGGAVASAAELGLDAAVAGWEVGRLSSGEKQRLALLRVLSRRPRGLLLDEPSANLDEAATLRVEALIRDYAQREAVPVLWVSHDPEQIGRVAGRHFRITAQGLEQAS